MLDLPPLRLVRARRLHGAEIVHHLDSRIMVTSKYRHVTVTYRQKGTEARFSLPDPAWRRAASSLRLVRRLLRADKCNVVAVDPHGTSFVVIRNRVVYHYDVAQRQLTPTLELARARNALHGAIANVDGSRLFFGEYSRNPEVAPVPVYGSYDGGRSWRKVFEFPQGKTTHVHTVAWDPVEERLWILTGDADGESWVVVADPDFRDVEWLGDGSQLWRAITPFFTDDAVYWGMDSPLETSRLVKLDRATRRAEALRDFPGPVWYGKALTDGWYVLASTAEPGPALAGPYARVFASRDLETWTEVAGFRKDALPPKYFKFGVIAFADGDQASREFAMHAEALRGLDGRAWLCRLDEA